MSIYKNAKSLLVIILLTGSITSCDLLQPGDIINPNVDEDTYINSSNAMTSWVNGTNSKMATVVGSFVELTEILSDDYFNNYSQSSKVFDFPTILYTDQDVTNLQRGIGTLREMALEGINTISKADKKTTSAQLFNLTYIEGYSYLLAGEYFVALPMENGGEPKAWQDHLNKAIEVFNSALDMTPVSDEKAFLYTLIARAYYRLGDETNAVKYADLSLNLSSSFIKQVSYDGKNGVNNSMQGYVYGNPYGTAFQPLPRLDFLDPKYFQTDDPLEQRPICIAKAEESYLIKAEASIADGSLTQAKQTMHTLLSLVRNRPVQSNVNDQLEGRYNGGYKEFPNSSEYLVAASADDPFRSNLVLDRQAPHVISVPYISGTSVTDEMVDDCTSSDQLLELLYLMRQEIFFAEGRRASDLGIRFPLCEVEAANHSAEQYTQAQIPSFIPLNQDMDAFTMDKVNKTVVIKYNMNKIIVNNKTSQYVVPFIH